MTIVSRPSSDQTSARSRREPAEKAWTGRPFKLPDWPGFHWVGLLTSVMFDTWCRCWPGLPPGESASRIFVPRLARFQQIRPATATNHPSTLGDMQRTIPTDPLADAVLSSTINHNAITPMFLTGCERICDPLVPQAILSSACLGSSSVERSAGNGVGRANAVRQS